MNERRPNPRSARGPWGAWRYAALGAAIAVYLSAVAGRAPLAAQGATGRIVPSAASVPAGDEVALTLRVDGVTDLAGFQVGLTWDAALLALEEVAPGDWLATSGRQVETVPPRVTERSLDFLVYTLPPAPDDPRPGVDGGGVLATARFRTRAPGQAIVNLRQLLLTTTANAPILAEVEGATFDIVAAPTPVPPRILLPYAITHARR